MLSLDDGPQMHAVADDGVAFKGWYADKALTKKVSDANPYRHPMTSRLDTFYTRFDREWVYIYTRLDEVLLVSDKPYDTDYAKQAFIVTPGSHCSISGKMGLPVITWWNNPENVSPCRIVAMGNTYAFTATTNLTLIPDCRMSSKEELSANPTATLFDQTPRQ